MTIEKSNNSGINKREQDHDIDRGFEFMLRKKKGRDQQDRPKTFHIKFGKMVSLFKREIHVYLNFSLDIKKYQLFLICSPYYRYSLPYIIQDA